MFYIAIYRNESYDNFIFEGELLRFRRAISLPSFRTSPSIPKNVIGKLLKMNEFRWYPPSYYIRAPSV